MKIKMWIGHRRWWKPWAPTRSEDICEVDWPIVPRAGEIIMMINHPHYLVADVGWEVWDEPVGPYELCASVRVKKLPRYRFRRWVPLP
jgi:hypothetical protein